MRTFAAVILGLAAIAAGPAAGQVPQATIDAYIADKPAGQGRDTATTEIRRGLRTIAILAVLSARRLDRR